MTTPVPYRHRRRVYLSPTQTGQSKIRSSPQWPLQRESWRHLVGHISSIVLVLALLLYGTHSLIYWRFYSALGLDPADVGLSYATVLSKATGYTVFLFLFGLLFLGAILLLFLIAALSDTLGPRIRGKKAPLRLGESFREYFRSRALMGVLGCMFVILGFLILPLVNYVLAGQFAAAVRDGRPLAYGPVPRLPVIDVRADPVQISPVGRPSDLPTVQGYVGREDLLILGQGNASLILYDPKEDKAVQIPSSVVVAKIGTCRNKSSMPQCRSAIG